MGNLTISQAAPAVQRAVRSGESFEEIITVLQPRLQRSMRKKLARYASEDETLVDIQDVSNWLHKDSRDAKNWLQREGVSPRKLTGRRGWYDRDEVSQAYCQRYLREYQSKPVQPLFEESDHEYQMGEQHDLNPKELVEEFVKTGKQTYLWQAVERLIVIRLKQKRIRKGTDLWDEGFSEIFMLLAGAFSRWAGGDGESLYRYLSKTANANALFGKDRTMKKYIQRYGELHYREIANES